MKFIVIFILLFLFVSLFKKGHQNTKDVMINHVKLSSTGHHPSLRILHLSDLHLENISITPSELYDKLKHEHIDLIALTGDFLDRKRTIPKLIPYLQVLKKLEAKYGIYAVLGNHDYVLKGKHLKKLINTLEHHHCNVLRNENIELLVNGSRLNIIGIDDYSTNRSDLEQAYEGLKSGYRLVLTHDPNIVLQMNDYHFDYLLAGHFHGGQICYTKAYHLFKMGKLVRMNMIKGLYTYANKPFYISEGLGQTGINIRVGSRPEITVHQCGLKKTIANVDKSVI